MVTNPQFDRRQTERTLYAAAGILFAVIVLIGFGRTYYLKFATGAPPLPSMLVHLHGILMTIWVLFFMMQVWLIRSKRPKVHMSMGMLGVVLSMMIVVIGFLTGAAAAKNGSSSAPPGIPPLAFFIVPVADLLIFMLLFGGAIYYRKRPADHKRLMLLTVLNFLPPAVARFPFDFVLTLGPLFFFGVPSVLAIGLVAYDTWKNRKLNRLFFAGSVLLVISYPLRLVISGTDAWMSFAAWITSWAA